MISLLDFAGSSAGPSSLFVALWDVAKDWDPSARASARPPGPRFAADIEGALLSDSIADVRDALRDTLKISVLDQASYRGQILAVMKAIDRAFYTIHPRVASLAPSTGVVSKVPEWLKEAREWRQVFGVYHEDEASRLIARGPLCRPSRHPTSANADTLADRFAALEVVPRSLNQSGRLVSISHKFLPVDAARGIEAAANVGHESVAFFPVAENAADIVKTEHMRGEQSLSISALLRIWTRLPALSRA
ncbi:hypothetical protein [Sinorhizobium fredii]|uniref:hypothetical protein n=1 Tax=Rhizobium fredii TaxID=380 RepID=UPI003397EE92